jgi:hypothetical protein
VAGAADAAGRQRRCGWLGVVLSVMRHLLCGVLCCDCVMLLQPCSCVYVSVCVFSV